MKARREGDPPLPRTKIAPGLLFDGSPRLCKTCQQPFEGTPHSQVCAACKKEGRRQRSAKWHGKDPERAKRVYKTCRTCKQIDNLSCQQCRERMQTRKHKTALRDAMRAGGLTRTADPTYARRYHLLRKFGLTLEQYDHLLAGQGGVCAICGRPPKKQALHVDHNHKEGFIRGLLCYRCNTMLDTQVTVERLKAIIAYLERPIPSLVVGVASNGDVPRSGPVANQHGALFKEDIE